MNQLESSRFLETEKISKLMVKFSVLCVDQIFIGNSAPIADFIAMIVAAALTIAFMQLLKIN